MSGFNFEPVFILIGAIVVLGVLLLTRSLGKTLAAVAAVAIAGTVLQPGFLTAMSGAAARGMQNFINAFVP